MRKHRLRVLFTWLREQNERIYGLELELFQLRKNVTELAENQAEMLKRANKILNRVLSGAVVPGQNTEKGDKN